MSSSAKNEKSIYLVFLCSVFFINLLDSPRITCSVMLFQLSQRTNEPKLNSLDRVKKVVVLNFMFQIEFAVN